MAFWVYMLRCSNGAYYVGHTDNLEKRLSEHHEGASDSYTSRLRPVDLIWSDEFPSRYEALVRERQIKGWSRAKKEALINENWDEISRLARSSAKKRPSTGSGRTE